MDSINKTDNFVFQTYQRQGKALVRGEGVYLWDEDGKKYIDFLAGIAVVSLGHCHPKITEAISRQASTLVHVSNLFYTMPQADLASKLCEKSFADRVFFANSGAEANEAAIKLSRRYFQKKGEKDRFKIITMEQSFHGRTMATLTATGQDKIKDGFYPLLKGFSHVPFNDIDALKNQIDETVCAIMLEPVQGEGGIIPADPDYLFAVRQLCNDKKILLIFDEIQCGMGRCGTLFAHELYGITPDIMTIAKALGNGFPIGAMLATQNAATGFDYGSHATTFGGTPLATAAALEVMNIISQNIFLDKVHQIGEYFKGELLKLKEKHTKVVEVRGKGLLLGLEIDKDAGFFVGKLFEKGFIINGIQDKILRFAPPLIIEKQEIDKLILALDSLL
ncbi:MAG: aspartate aminotransferase family protein [Desulfobacula sp.]|uniref:aspartate aminotransferase family protein n=1 Tax=Desulfobacula sp. TaxID=2593537 RepID=UPI001D5351A0|nr:aspartate aminotransferase family protein [Desulfobacula sp.]MBT3486914.1 aspartate aminotransferase family protein [Desulfobacula sp.]MBT3805610.1 aspartate aminotransferase family protein [Desulfobacula sp.]MBT4199627.1 aspartate aminotransferase family protein [Desulfobacula sp.]MBT4506946.1 aspartate aminotransferase family protein [Desulfobacula sp.]